MVSDIRRQINNILEWKNNLSENVEDVLNGEDLIAYHRSPKKISKFDLSYSSKEDYRQGTGYGLYFSNKIPHTQYGEYLYKVKLTNIVLLDSKLPVDDEIVTMVADALKKEKYKYEEIFDFTHRGSIFYRTVHRILHGYDRKTALFFTNIGIDGLKSHQGGDSYDYVLFNDDKIRILDTKYSV